MKVKKSVIVMALVLAASVLAIASKVILPSEVNVGDFDSVFVKALGFEIIATLYFVMIYAHNAIVTLIFGRRSELSNKQIGLRFGICFALIYLLGMQEPVMESAPFGAWGIDFVVYQFFMGAGEAIAAMLLCMAVSMFVIDKKNPAQAKPVMPFRDKASAIFMIAAAFTIVRAIAYETGIIHNNADSFLAPAYVWTVMFGIAAGFCFTLLYPVFINQPGACKPAFKITVLTIGLGWMIFNLFIGLIFAGAMAEVLLRGGMDVAAMCFAALIWEKFMQGKQLKPELR